MLNITGLTPWILVYYPAMQVFFFKFKSTASEQCDPWVSLKAGATKTKTYENEDLRPNTRS